MTSQSSLYVIGGTHTNLSKKYPKTQLLDLVRDTVYGTVAFCGLSPKQIGCIEVSNALGGPLINQTHFAGIVATACPEFDGLPAGRNEAACASGSAAILAAMAKIRSGMFDVALVVGFEIMKDKAARLGDDPMDSASWDPGRTERHQYVWANYFSKIADAYKDRHGLDYDYLRAISARNYSHAKCNPKAQTYAWETPPAYFSDDNLANPPIAGMFRRSDCSQITDGGAGIVIVSDRWLRENRNNIIGPVAEITGWGHTTTTLSLQEQLRASIGAEYMFPHLRKAITDALGRAGIKSALDLDLIELHDCFSFTQALATDHFGITKPGCMDESLAITALDGLLPVNPSGGLIGAGHPLGATGIIMLLNAYLQVTNQATCNQVNGAQTAATLNLGGTATSVFSYILESMGVS